MGGGLPRKGSDWSLEILLAVQIFQNVALVAAATAPYNEWGTHGKQNYKYIKDCGKFKTKLCIIADNCQSQ